MTDFYIHKISVLYRPYNYVQHDMRHRFVSSVMQLKKWEELCPIVLVKYVVNSFEKEFASM